MTIKWKFSETIHPPNLMFTKQIATNIYSTHGPYTEGVSVIVCVLCVCACARAGAVVSSTCDPNTTR